MTREGEIKALNTIRALAAILVCVGHVRVMMLPPAEFAAVGWPVKLLYLLTSLGHGAVIVFFVLSGYFVGGSVITAKLRDSFSPTKYMINRLTRLWLVLLPAISVAICIQIIVGRSVGSGFSSWLLPFHTMAIQALGNAFFLQPHIIETFPTDGALWSMGCEFTCYLLFPLIYVGLRSRAWPSRITAACIIAVLLAAAGLTTDLLFIIWLFGAGIARWRQSILNAVNRLTPRTLNFARCVTVIGVILAMILDYSEGGYQHRTPLGSFLTGATTALLVSLYLNDVAPVNPLGRLTIGAGNRCAHSSFSLYAVHQPFLSLAWLYLFDVHGRHFLYPGLGGWTIVTGITLALMGLGAGFWWLTERHNDTVRRWFITKFLPTAEQAAIRNSRSMPIRSNPEALPEADTAAAL